MSYGTEVENLYYALAAHCSPSDYSVKTVLDVFSGLTFKMNMLTSDYITTSDYLNRFPENRRNMLYAALERGVRDPYHYAFVKKDKLMVDKYKVPRVVLASSDETIANFGPWYFAFSKKVKNQYTKIHSPEFLATGVSGEDVGAWFTHWYNHINPTWYVVTDFSKMDRSENVLMIMWEWTNYFASMSPSQQRKFRPYYLDQLVVLIRGMAGGGGAVRIGGKCSGCLNTCIGNSMQHIQLLRHFCKLEGLVIGKHLAYLLLGDDLLVLSNKYFSLAKYDKFCLSLGFTVKSSITTVLAEVDFCQKIFFPTSDGFMPGPKIGRYLSKIGHSFKDVYDVSSSIFSEDLNHVPLLRLLKGVNVSKRWEDWELHNLKIHTHIPEADLFFLQRYKITVPNKLSDLTPEVIRIIDRVDNGRNAYFDYDGVEKEAHKRFLSEGGVVTKQPAKLKKFAQGLIDNIRIKFSETKGLNQNQRFVTYQCLQHLGESLNMKTRIGPSS